MFKIFVGFYQKILYLHRFYRTVIAEKRKVLENINNGPVA
jgi:hypothetical protein